MNKEDMDRVIDALQKGDDAAVESIMEDKAEVPKGRTKACQKCGVTFSHRNPYIYKNLCSPCYRATTFPCDKCGKELVSETHRQNNGLCFDCFHQPAAPVGDEERDKSIAALVASLEYALPEKYVEFLRTYDGKQQYAHPASAVRGMDWRMASAIPSHEFLLDEPVNVDGNKGVFRGILGLYSRSMREWSGPIQPALQKYGLDRLAQGFAIGEANGDTLFLDPGDGMSVWYFWHEGDVQRLAQSFEAWLAKAKKRFKPFTETRKTHQQYIPDYVGRWKPMTSPKEQFPAHLLGDEFEFLADGRARRIYIDLEAGEKSESFGLWRIYGKDKLGFYRDGEEDVYIRLPDGRLKDNYDHMGIVYAKEADPFFKTQAYEKLRARWKRGKRPWWKFW